MTTRVRIILQARTSSSRLPAKVLLPIGGMPLAVLCVRRLGATGHDVVLATSVAKSDDLLARVAQKADIKIFRGSLSNVLERFVQCVADLDDHDIVVRATADNPLPDGSFIDALLQEFQQGTTSYLGTSWPNDGLPYGVGAEVMTVGALRSALANTDQPYDLEHVTPWLTRQSGIAGCTQRGWLLDQDYAHLRATIDTLDDYLAIAPTFNDIVDPVHLDWKVLIPKLPEGAIPMPQIPIVRRNGESYSSITLGTVQLGMNYGIANHTGQPNDADTATILAMAVDSGVTYLDTARAYGESESRIGRFLPGSAKSIVKIVTKLEPMDAIPDDASEHEIKSTVDASIFGSCHDLRREYLDIVMFHRSADMFRWNGAAIDRMMQHVDQKVVRALGVSVYTPEEALKCLADNRITQLQIPFNFLDSRWLDGPFLEVLAQRPEVHVHVRSVFLQGLLINGAEAWPDWFAPRYEFAQRVEEVTKELKRKSKSDLCIAYVRSFPWVTSVVLGVETPRQLEELLSYATEPVLMPDQAEHIRSSFVDIPERLINPSQW